MNYAMISYLLGRVLLCEGALLTLPLIVALIYRENTSISAFMLTILICLAFGLVFTLKKPEKQVFHLREGFIITALSWVIISVMGALPFLFSGSIQNTVDALFETVSGFTTTGASILSDVEILPKSIIFWRSFTHWIGGMGVLVFLLMVTPLKDGSHVNLMKAESPGPQVEKLVPRLQNTAGILYGIYIAMTLVQLVLMLLGDISFFDAITLTFGTAGTGGFGIRNDSMASFSPYIQTVVSIFMVLFGVNFTFYFLLLCKKARRAFSMAEVRWYLIIILVAVVLIFSNTYHLYGSVKDTLLHAFFQVGSIITTTGYSTVDFNMWPELSRTVLVLLMFIGACAGSTGGGIKVSRFLIMVKTACKEIKNYLHPSQVSKVTIDKKPVPHEIVRSVNVYMVAYILIFAASVLLISLDNFDLTTNFTAIATTFNNVGPGLEGVGPMSNFSAFSPFSKLVMIFDMLAGRLEIFPLLLLFAPGSWKKY